MKANHADNAAKGLLNMVGQLLPGLHTLLLHLFSHWLEPIEFSGFVETSKKEAF